MTVQAAATLAQVLPALFAIGVLVPILSKNRPTLSDRRLFRSLSSLVVIVEGLCIWSFVTDTPLPSYTLVLVGITVVYMLIAIWMIFDDWAKKTAGEGVEEKLAKDRRFRERREFLKRSVEGIRKVFRSAG